MRSHSDAHRIQRSPSQQSIQSSPGSQNMTSAQAASRRDSSEAHASQSAEAGGSLSMRNLMSRVGSLGSLLAGGPPAKVGCTTV